MKKHYLLAVICGLAIAGAACDKKTEGDESTTADTATVPGTDTVNMPTAVPTTDTVVKTTTTETDTIHGEGKDTTKH